MYTDFDFYKNSYVGNSVPEEAFEAVCNRACEFIDVITLYRLADGGIPEKYSNRIQRAVCMLCDVVYDVMQGESNARQAVNDATSATQTAKSLSAGSESITYASSSDHASGAKAWSAVYNVVGDPQAQYKLMYNTVRPLLNGISVDGVPILYLGV